MISCDMPRGRCEGELLRRRTYLPFLMCHERGMGLEIGSQEPRTDAAGGGHRELEGPHGDART